MSEPLNVFFSYAHKDEDLRDELAVHLSILKRQGKIQPWHDRKILSGKEWAGEIDDNLNTADIILLLVSPTFMASDYCWDVELTRALERHEAHEALVIPIILRPTDWNDAPFAKLQALPKNAKPVTTWSNRDEAFLSVAKGLRSVIEGELKRRAERPVPASPTPSPSRLGTSEAGVGAEALALWREKLSFFLREQAITADAGQKFALKKQIEEAKAKIRGLEGA